MDLLSALASHLRGLVDNLGTEDDTLTDSLEALASLLVAVVPSYLGFRLTLVIDEWPITLTEFSVLDGERPATSLRLNLSTQGSGFDPDSQIVLYAANPGAFVDLAADIDYLHRHGQRSRWPRTSAGGRARHRPAADHARLRVSRTDRVRDGQPGDRDADPTR